MVRALTIRDRVFDITKATLSGGLHRESVGAQVFPTGVMIRDMVDDRTEFPAKWRCNWLLNIETAERKFTSDGGSYTERWQPRAYSHDIPIILSDWKKFDGMAIQCDGPAKANKCKLTGPFHLYVYEHADVTRNRLKFSDRRGRLFDLVWEGLCDVYADNDYDEDIPFRVETEIQFTDITIVEVDPCVARDAFSQVFNPRNFVQHPPQLWKHTSKPIPPGGTISFEPNGEN